MNLDLGLSLTPQGVLPAAARPADRTHYDAIWVRDSVWGYFALGGDPEAQRLLEALVHYFDTPAQLTRFRACIEDPKLATGEAGKMNLPHIRFDAATFDDVLLDGKPQIWNHRQNDALGLFGIAVYDAMASGRLSRDASQAAKLLPEYFDRVRFHQMEDAGAWEEIDRINSSSVALVLGALERARRLGGFGNLDALIDKGYRRLLAQLPFESPAYARTSPKFREADAALLAVIYPAELERVTVAQSVSILRVVQTLVREKGVCRYLGDSYQSGNYWRADDTTTLTDDCSAEDAFLERRKRMIPDTEAQWFFDSWMAIVYAKLSGREPRDEFQKAREFHLKRALAQATPSEGTLAADGRPVGGRLLPESYNTLVAEDGSKSYAPSPITPLNWAKASLRLALSF